MPLIHPAWSDARNNADLRKIAREIRRQILELSFNPDYNEARREYGSFRLSDVAAPYAAVTR